MLCFNMAKKMKREQWEENQTAERKRQTKEDEKLTKYQEYVRLGSEQQEKKGR